MTAGVVIVEGLLVLKFPRAIPDVFWDRLRHTVAKAGELDAYERERHASRDGEGRPWEREERLFRRWVERACGPQPLWPWDRGWTAELVGSYLEAPSAPRRAA